MAAHGGMDRLVWRIHSANPVGQKNIQAAMNSAERFWQDVKDPDEGEYKQGKDEWR